MHQPFGLEGILPFQERREVVLDEGRTSRMHETADLRKAHDAVVGFYFEHSHRRPHWLLKQRRRDRNVLKLQDFNVSDFQSDSPFQIIIGQMLTKRTLYERPRYLDGSRKTLGKVEEGVKRKPMDFHSLVFCSAEIPARK